MHDPAQILRLATAADANREMAAKAIDRMAHNDDAREALVYLSAAVDNLAEAVRALDR